MTDLTIAEKIVIMRMAVDADWSIVKREDEPESKVIEVYHAMIKAIGGSGKQKKGEKVK